MTDEDARTYGDLIRDAEGLISMRKVLGHTQGQLAGLLGIDAGTLSRWERGRQTIANPDLLGYALLGVCAAEVATADAWRSSEALAFTPSLITQLARLRQLATMAGLVDPTAVLA